MILSKNGSVIKVGYLLTYLYPLCIKIYSLAKAEV